MKSRAVDYADEMAVMFDTDRPLNVTEQAMVMDDPKFPMRWLSDVSEPCDGVVGQELNSIASTQNRKPNAT